MNTERAIERARGRIDQDTVTRLAVDLVSIPSPTGLSARWPPCSPSATP